MAQNQSPKSIKRLYLSDEDKKLAGLCGGIAAYFEVDGTLIRLAWLIATFISGVIPGIVAYIIAAIITPKQPINTSG